MQTATSRLNAAKEALHESPSKRKNYKLFILLVLASPLWGHILLKLGAFGVLMGVVVFIYSKVNGWLVKNEKRGMEAMQEMLADVKDIHSGPDCYTYQEELQIQRGIEKLKAEQAEKKAAEERDALMMERLKKRQEQNSGAN